MIQIEHHNDIAILTMDAGESLEYDIRSCFRSRAG